MVTPLFPTRQWYTNLSTARKKRIILIASLFVLINVHRVRQEDFIRRSFLDGHGHDNAGGGGGSNNQPVLANNVLNIITDAINNNDGYGHDRGTSSTAKGSNNNNNNNNINNREEPYVLLHVGPHKTGTTTLQQFLLAAHANSNSNSNSNNNNSTSNTANNNDSSTTNSSNNNNNNNNSNNNNFLQKDNLQIPTLTHLPGPFTKMPMLNFAHCMISKFKKDGGDLNAQMCNRIHQHTLPPYLQQSYNQSKNILIVAEDLDRPTIDYERIRYYLRPYTKIVIVATYRRMHDWFPSFYNQIVDHYTGVYANNKGEEEYPSFVTWMNETYRGFYEKHTVPVIQRFKEHGFEEVSVMNMHDDAMPLLENFICRHVPRAEFTCRAIREEEEEEGGASDASVLWKETKTNVGTYHEYERLAIMAHHRGKLQLPSSFRWTKKNVRKVAMAIERGMDKAQRILVMNYGKQCLPKEILEELLQIEMEQERALFPEWYDAQGGDEALRLEFDKVARTKLCSLNVEKILEMGILENVFKNLKQQQQQQQH